MAAKKFFSVPSGTAPFYPVSIPYSCRSEYVRDTYLYKTPSVAGNRKTFTLSFWVKFSGIVSTIALFSAGSASNDPGTFFTLYRSSTGLLSLECGASTTLKKATCDGLLRDPSHWSHIVLAVDTTQATDTNRIKMWVNGTAQTFAAGYVAPAQNADLAVNNTVVHEVMRDVWTHEPARGYFADFYLIDGTALTASSFGEFSTQNPTVWIPKTPTGLTYGTNGFHLAFGNASALGTDTSGNGNTYTSSGLTTADQFTDTPTNNYCTLNPLALNPATFTEGNLKATTAAAKNAVSTFGVSTGKWYWEVKANTVDSSSGYPMFGAFKSAMPASAGSRPGLDENGFGRFLLSTDGIYIDKSRLGNGPSTIAANDVMGFALDCDAGTCGLYKNNSLEQTLTGLGSGTFFPAIATATNATVSTFNFGATAFTYTPPTGFKALCSANLPDPSIIDSTKGFDAKLYTGTGAAQNITGFNFQPDLVWAKDRTNAGNHNLHDSVRGATKALYSNLTDAEFTQVQGLTAFLTNGFSLGTASGCNANADNFVSWCWKKGATFGFDIVSYTGTGASRTVPHNLGAVPELIITKDMTQAYGWQVYHKASNATPQNYYAMLQSANAFAADSTAWNNTAPTTGVFTVGSSGYANNSGDNYIAYLFRSVPGFSLIGSYTANGNTDGPFVYCGFRPRFILAKNASYAGCDWQLFDATRNTYNVAGKWVAANTTAVESDMSTKGFDILSNGFKVRGTDGYYNRVGSTDTIIFAAFAEAPFKYANAR